MFISINMGFDVEHDPTFNLEILKKKPWSMCVYVCVIQYECMNVWLE